MSFKKTLGKIVTYSLGSLLVGSLALNVFSKKDYNITKFLTKEGRIERQIYNKSINQGRIGVENRYNYLSAVFWSEFKFGENERKYELHSWSDPDKNNPLHKGGNDFHNVINASPPHDYIITIIENKKDSSMLVFIRNRKKFDFGGGLVDSKIMLYEPCMSWGQENWKKVEELPYSQLEPDLQKVVKKEYEMFLDTEFVRNKTKTDSGLERIAKEMKKRKQERKQEKIRKKGLELQHEKEDQEILNSMNEKIREHLIKK